MQPGSPNGASAAAKAADVVATIETAKADTAALSIALGVTVEAVEAVTTEEVVLAPPPPVHDARLSALSSDEFPAAIPIAIPLALILIGVGVWHARRVRKRRAMQAASAAKLAPGALETEDQAMASNWGGALANWRAARCQ